MIKNRITTREVRVGNMGIGASNPIRVQTMTSTPTSDTRATVEQILRIATAGADIVRMTVRNKKEAENLENIKRELKLAGCLIPLVADVHFNPAIAEIAATIVDKVRINPGNYGISQGMGKAALSDAEYSEELLAARTAFSRLLSICRKHGTALRIGVNHGSLSPRIINRYGNTPAGMVNSAMEFLQFCSEVEFHNVVVSLKSSNTRIMVESNRMMAENMQKEGLIYPLHLGVTEAGEGEDGRIRSVAGIGTLLWEGIGDTIRVSLTEDPQEEVPVARKLITHITMARETNQANKGITNDGKMPASEFSRQSFRAGKTGGGQVPVVIGELTGITTGGTSGGGISDGGAHEGSADEGSAIDGGTPEVDTTDVSAREDGIPEVDTTDVSAREDGIPDAGTPDGIAPEADYQFASMITEKRLPAEANKIIVEASFWLKHFHGRKGAGMIPLVNKDQYISGKFSAASLIFLQVTPEELTVDLLAGVAGDRRVVFVALSQSHCPPAEMMQFIAHLEKKGCTNPVIFKKVYHAANDEDFQIAAAADFAPLFIDGMGDGIWLSNKLPGKSALSVSTSFSLLQSARVRTSKTEFISCPSCGRTTFDIRKATAAVKQKTSHLRGLTIAVMGCIVNGPGEMADADYGYVGSGRGKVTLYRKQEVVKRNVSEETALEELIALIKESGDWVDN